MECEAKSAPFLSAEDDAADTLKPRLLAATADVSRVHVLDAVVSGYTGNGRRGHRAFSLESDIDALSAELNRQTDVALVVIDPITAYLGGVDSHKNAEVRALLTPLADLASRHEVAIVGVTHMNKGGNPQALMRMTGSVAFGAAARAAWLVAADAEDSSRRLFLPMKNNLGPDESGLSFHIEPARVSGLSEPIPTSRVVWDSEPATERANDVLSQIAAGDERSALGEAAAWLESQLGDGPMSARELKRDAGDAGFSWPTIRRAKERLKVESAKSGMNGPWLWSLPKVLKISEDAQEKNVSTFGKVEHLRGPEGEVIELG